jgi:excisionase family DNA binding protein
MKISDKDKITTTQAADILGVSPATVRKWVMNQWLPFESLGRNNFVSRKYVEKINREPASAHAEVMKALAIVREQRTRQTPKAA